MRPDDSSPDRRAVLTLAALGYAYLASLFAGLVLLTVVLIRSSDYAAFAVLPAGTLLFVIGALFLSIEAPQGRMIKAGEAPELFRLIERTSAAMQSPLPHAVFLTWDINAAVMEVPRFAGLGSRRWLLMGLPLLHVLHEDELRAVLAHEFAHLSRRHGRAQLWPIRVQNTWNTLAVASQWSRSRVSFLFVPFAKWYTPRLSARIHAMSRRYEIESDRLASEYAGAEALGKGLVGIALAGSYAQRVVMPGLFRDSVTLEAPPPGAVQRVSSMLRRYRDDPDVASAFKAVLADSTSQQDSHPSTKERLAALGLSNLTLSSIMDARRSGRVANDVLLDPETASGIATELSELWASHHAVYWRSLHLAAQIGSGGNRESADDIEIEWARARWAAACLPPRVAVPLVRPVLQRQPHQGEARALLGQLLIESFESSEQDEGEQLLEEAVRDESGYALTAVAALRRHYLRRGHTDQLLRLDLREQQLNRAVVDSLRERGVLTYGDGLRPYRVSKPELDHLQKVFGAHPEIHRAYLLQKKTRFLAARPVYFLAFTAQVTWYKPALAGLAERLSTSLAREIAIGGDADVIVVALEPGSALERRIRKLDGAAIYRRGEEVPAAPTSDWSRPSWLGIALRGHPVRSAGVLLFLVLWAVTFVPPSTLRPEPPKTIGHWRSAVARNPEDPVANAELMWELVEMDSLDQALAIAPTAVRLNPGNAYVHNSLGWLLMSRDQYQEALPSFRTAIRLNPRHEYAHANLGWTLLHLGRSAEADTAFRHATDISPKSPEIRLNYATALTSLGRNTEAEAQLRRAIELDGKNGYYRFVLGEMLRSRGDLGDALHEFEIGAELEPDNPMIWSHIGIVHHELGHVDQARQALRRAEQLSPGYLKRANLQTMLDSLRTGQRSERK